MVERLEWVLLTYRLPREPSGPRVTVWRKLRRLGVAQVLDGLVALPAYLSAILLGGLVLNAAMGWWWADPVAALAIAALAVNEGREAWRGDVCCD